MSAKVNDLWLMTHQQFLQPVSGDGEFLDQVEAPTLRRSIQRMAQLIKLPARLQPKLISWVGSKKENPNHGWRFASLLKTRNNVGDCTNYHRESKDLRISLIRGDRCVTQ